MRDFPQELVDKVIDNLNELLEQPAPEGSSQHKLSDYSTVSKRWVNRTQHHHFRSLWFTGQNQMQQWRETIKPDPSGVSRHVRALYWLYIDILDGLEDHLRALTNINEAHFHDCDIFHHLDNVRLLSQVASNLVELYFSRINIAPAIITSFLAVCPCLRHFCTNDLRIELDDAPVVSPDNIPFFKGANSLTLQLKDCLPGNLSWFPSTVRFTNLAVGASCIHHDWDLVNGWIASSRETLECFDIDWEPECDDHVFIPLDFSKCTNLRTLRLPLLFNKPEFFSDTVSSITSPMLPKIALYFTSTSDTVTWVNPQPWKRLEESLCRLAKQSRTLQGEKLLAEISLHTWDCTVLPPLSGEGGILPSLSEEARVVMNVVDGQASANPIAVDLEPDLEPDLLGPLWGRFSLDDVDDGVDTPYSIPGSLPSTSPESTPSGATHSPPVAEVDLGDDNLPYLPDLVVS